MTTKSKLAVASVACLCLAVLTAQPASAGGAGTPSHRNWSGSAKAFASTRTNQVKWHNPVSSRVNVKPGDKNTLSPQPLPPGSGRSQ
jgi:hypothetical protein